MKRCGKTDRALRADRVVRPYRTFCVFADGVCNFAIAHRRGERGIDPYGNFAWSPMARRNFVIASCRGERGIDPYGRITMLPFVARFCRCTVRGRGKPLPYVTTKHDTAQKKLPFSSSVTFGDSFPSKGSLGLLQTRQCSAIYFAQSMTCSLFSRKNVLIFENGWLPKKPR